MPGGTRARFNQAVFPFSRYVSQQLRQLLLFPAQQIRLKLQHFQRALGPVVLPANDQVALLGIMVMHDKITALKFKFDQYPLPAIPIHPPDRLAIWIRASNVGNHESQCCGQRSKQAHHAHLIDRRESNGRWMDPGDRA